MAARKTDNDVDTKAQTQAEKKLAAFTEAIKNLDREYSKQSATGDTIIAKMKDKPRDVKRISTGSLVFDSINGGGFPMGRIVEIYGPEASGKTSFSLIAAGNAQSKGGTAALIDLEHAFDPVYAKTLGVNVDELAVAQPDNAEQALNLMRDLVDTGVVDVVILDSIGALATKASLEGRAEDQTIGTVARLLSKELPALAIKASKTGTLCIFINQIRATIGGYGGYETTMGGRAMKFAASQRVDIRRRKPATGDGGEIIGNNIDIKIVKNKTGRPFGIGSTVLTFGKGVNKAAEMIEVGTEYGIIDKTSPVTYVEVETGEKIASRGKDAAIRKLEEDHEMYERLSKALKAKIDERMNGNAPDEGEDRGED